MSSLTLSGNKLTSLDGTGMSSLTTLYVDNNSFTTFSGTGFSALTTLYITGNTLLTSFTNSAAMTSLTRLDIYGCSSLSSLTFSNGALNTISLAS